MRILLTGATEGLGRAVAQGLLAAGREVSGIAERAHADLDPGVEFVRAALAHPVLYEMMAQADVVIQLPTNPAGPRPSDVARVCDAAARTGARVIFPSLSLVEPDGWQPAEELVATGWAPSLIVRLAAPVGRQADALVCRTIATLLQKSSADAVRVLHIDDLIRFLVMAADSPHAGTVDLGTQGMAASWHVRQVLGSINPRLQTRGVKPWSRLDADMDLAKVHDRWGFECGWGATDAVEDTARGLQGRRLSAAGAVPIPDQFPLPVHVVPDPGADISPTVPMTPMSADLHLGALRIAERQLAALEHRSRVRTYALARGFAQRAESYAGVCAEERLSVDAIRALRDAQLDVRIRLLRNRVHEGWGLWAASSVLLEPNELRHADPVGTEIDTLAAIIRAHSYIQAMIDDGDTGRARTAAPMFGTGLDRLIGRIGHRGPAELELSSKVFADRPELLVASARRAMTASARRAMIATSPISTEPADPAETAHDTTVAYTHQLRLAVRELAVRLVAAEKLASVDDVYYLTIDEVLTMPADAELRIKVRFADGDGAAAAGGVSADTCLRGTAVHSGAGEGIIRVIESVDDLPVRRGEVAVVAAADARFVALMGTPEAVIFDGDRLVDEFSALPSVLLSGANHQFCTGMRVRVDGTAGSVTVLAKESLGELTVAR
jgi:nucleoside-diphosphate-sugar epimerase